MRKNDTQMNKSELLPFHIIKAASEGDRGSNQICAETL